MSTEETVKTPARKKAASKAVKTPTAEPTVKAEKVTKPKAAKAAAKKTAEPIEIVAVAQVELKPIPVPTHEEIAQLAVQYWIERGYEHGKAEQDWFRAEQQLRGIAS